MHEGYGSNQAYKKTTELYQLGSYDHLWNCHSYPWLIYKLYNLNQTLKKDTKIQLYGCDIEFDWNNNKTEEEYTAIDPILNMRDSLMADNFIKQYTQVQKSRNGKKKALVIMNSRHGFLKDICYSETSVRNNTGRYLYDKYKDRVASVFMMSPGHPNSMDEYTVIKDGKWDAYFELSGKTDVGFNLRNTPFGQSEFDYRPIIKKHNYEDIYTGLVFYKPIETHLLKRGWKNAITDDFKPELVRRMKIMGFDDDEIKHELKIENTERSEQYPDVDKMRKKIDGWKDQLLYEKLLEKNIIQKTDSTGIFESKAGKDELYYYALVPKETIKGVLVLLPSTLEETESVLENNKELCRLAFDKGIMTVVPSTNAHICLDEPVLDFLNKTFADVISRYGAPKDKFIIGGFSLGGIVSLRYTEMAYENASQVSAIPCAAFSVDGPVDFITMYEQFENDIKKNINWGAVAEANYYIDGMHKIFGGSPKEAYANYMKHSVYTRGEDKGGNAQYLKNVPVRIYSDPDIDWAIKERQRDLYDMNAPDHTALIVELNLQGNNNAEFINRLGKGYRLDGTRHPHSWSLVDADDCVEWMLKCIK